MAQDSWGAHIIREHFEGKSMKKTLAGLLLAAAVLVVPSVSVFAGTVSITGDKDTAAVGESYTVNVKIEDTDGAASAPEVSVNYDTNRLEFVSCSGEYGGGGGGLITLSGEGADITFNILSGGQASVDVTAIFDGDGANPQTTSAYIAVDGEDTAAAMGGDDGGSGTGIEAGSVATPDGNIVSSVFADEFMPVGFYKTTVSYEEQMVEAAQFDMGGIVLLYVTDATGNNGNFKMYDQATGELSDFLQITGIENRFIIALKAGEEVTIPKDFAKATLQWNSQSLEAYAYVGEATDFNGINPSDFFLLYAVSSEGNRGLYMYDQSEGTYQRFVEGFGGGAAKSSDEGLLSQITAPVMSDSDEGGVNVLLIIVIGLGVLLLALIITVIVMGIKLHEYNSYDYIDEDEEDNGAYLNRLAAAQDNAMFDPRAAVQREKAVDADDEESSKEEDFVIENIDEDAGSGADDNTESNIPDGFVVRKKNDNGELNDGEGFFSPHVRDYSEDDLEDDEDDYPRRMSRAEKKAMKQAEKARKKEEKRLKKEYGEYGPVDWDAWQNGMEGGARTAAAQIDRNTGVIDDIPEEPRRVEKPQKVERTRYEEDEVDRKQRPIMEDEPVRRQRPVMEEEPDDPRRNAGKGNPMEMMRQIPANDNKAPVQARPVQQFDFDDDFEFEFLNLDDDDE